MLVQVDLLCYATTAYTYRMLSVQATGNYSKVFLDETCASQVYQSLKQMQAFENIMYWREKEF